jgi:hypothetical protein
LPLVIEACTLSYGCGIILHSQDPANKAQSRTTLYPRMATSHDSRISKPASARHSQTCETCKKRHQKCNGARPQCSNCELRHLSCTYSGVRSRGFDRIPNEPPLVASTLLLVLIPQALGMGSLIAVIEVPLREGWPSQTLSMLAYATSCSMI